MRRPALENPDQMPRVAVADLNLQAPDGTFSIGREAFPQFGEMQTWGVHVQSDRVRIARPDAAYVEAGPSAPGQAGGELGVDEAALAFVGTAPGPPAIRPR